MEIKEIHNKEAWEDFLAECKQKTFLHSWQWGEFQELMREKVWRFGVYEKGELKAAALAVKVAAKRGTFLLVPHGPVVKEPRKEILQAFLPVLQELGKKEGASFIRVNPVWERTPENESAFAHLGFRSSSMQMHPEASWKLHIAPPQEELMAAMRKTTRYLIRQTSKNQDIAIQQSKSSADVGLFSDMHKLVSGRQSFVPFSKEYLEKEFQAFSKEDEVRLLFGTHKGEIAAAAFVVFWSGIGFYHHAASLPRFSKLSIPYLLVWEAIREAKKKGCTLFDFWGYVDPKTQPRHPWAGPTLFKQGFGGEAHLYVKAKDYPLGFGYWPTALFETVRRIKRGL